MTRSHIVRIRGSGLWGPRQGRSAENPKTLARPTEHGRPPRLPPPRTPKGAWTLARFEPIHRRRRGTARLTFGCLPATALAEATPCRRGDQIPMRRSEDRTVGICRALDRCPKAPAESPGRLSSPGKPVVERRVSPALEGHPKASDRTARLALPVRQAGRGAPCRLRSALAELLRPDNKTPANQHPDVSRSAIELAARRLSGRRLAMHEPANRLVHTLAGVANDIGRVAAARSPRRRPGSTSLATRTCARMARRPEPAPPLTDHGHPRRAAPSNRNAARATEPIPKDRPVSSRSARPTPKRRTNQSHRTA